MENPTKWEWNPNAPLWPWAERFFTIELLYEYEGLGIENPTARLCRLVGRELKHQAFLGAFSHASIIR